MKPVSFYLVTDTHYLNNVLEPGGEAFEKNMVTEQYFVRESGDIIKSVFDKEIIYTLRKMSTAEIAELPDVSEGLENKIKMAANSCNTLPELIEKMIL